MYRVRVKVRGLSALLAALFLFIIIPKNILIINQLIASPKGNFARHSRFSKNESTQNLATHCKHACSLKSLLTPKSPKGDFFKLLIFSNSPLGVRGENGKNQQFEGFLYCTQTCFGFFRILSENETSMTKFVTKEHV